MVDPFVALGRVDEIPAGQGRAFTIGKLVISVFHVNGEFFAIDDACPHMGASLSEGCVENGVVACPWHGWRFDVRDGTWCDNPRVKIGAYPVRIENGEIWVAVPEQNTT
ncbi:MAG TPA: nitrite reductase small subunit NirD [Pirellulaceae bacterium]|nr:nitrite reductase small subunit NirD [Pirellulaceae bacterium]